MLSPVAICVLWAWVAVKAMSASIALPVPLSVLMSVAPVTTEDRTRMHRLSPLFTGCNTRVNWTCLSPTIIIGMQGPAPGLSSTVELTLLAAVQGSWHFVV